MMWDFKFVV